MSNEMNTDLEARYQKAIEEFRDSLSSERVKTTKKLFEDLGDYRDSAKYVAKCEKFLAWGKGNHVSFGNYHGNELTWKVLSEKGRERLLIADHTVDNKPFHVDRDHTNWSLCSLRKWLNKEFLEESFTLQERMMILLTQHMNNTDPRWSVENGPATRDKAFIFDMADLEEYLPLAEDRAIGEWWWLRGHGAGLLSLTAVYEDGTVYKYGVNKNADTVGVRPAMWVRLPQ